MKRLVALRRWEAATEPTSAAMERLRRRIVGPDHATLLQEVRRVDDRAVERLRQRLRPPFRVGSSWVKLGIPLAVAAGIFASLRAVPTGHLDERLTAMERTERALTPAVALAFRGSGAATGPFASPRLHWDVGTLEVEVDPSAGVNVIVETREATVRVIGTGFTVIRDALGTTVDVAHGAVAVSCGDGWAGTLHVGEHHTCLPLTAPGWLLRVQALRDQGANADALLLALDRGSALVPDSDPVAAELVEIRVEVLVEAGRTSEASEVARRYPPTGPRASEMLRLTNSIDATTP